MWILHGLAGLSVRAMAGAEEGSSARTARGVVRQRFCRRKLPLLEAGGFFGVVLCMEAGQIGSFVGRFVAIVRGSGEEGRESLAGSMTKVLSVYHMSAITRNALFWARIKCVMENSEARAKQSRGDVRFQVQ